ncbi:hyperosmotically inducible protein [Paraburkholderia sp. GAS199]|uniref:BON domain-containing protein n=1 Tax=Paraburkholderia sp. GAS199 TaxID=3035126 RepID=UPI003D23C5C0
MNRKILCAVLVGIAAITAVPSYAQTDGTPAVTASKKATPADRALGKSVRRALSKAPGFDVSGVFVRARGGAVTLSGSVKSGAQIQQAQDVAQSVQGVQSVTNKLTLFHGGNG